MRASQIAKHSREKAPTARKSLPEVHISGAEGIYRKKEISEIVSEYVLRALGHQKGRPDSIFISVEALTQKPLPIQSLPVSTLKCRSSVEAIGLVRNLLASCGVSARAIRTSLSVTGGGNAMRGASLVLSSSGRKVEKDKVRGIRASRLGISAAAGKILSRRLALQGINTSTVREALILASKVAACPQVLAELCVSDDPGYTTGYVSSRKFGYVRVPHIKRKGEKKGGRVFFLEEDTDPQAVAEFLEETPVLVNKISPVSGLRSLHEIIGHTNR